MTSRPVRTTPRVLARMSAQHGLITRADALDLGLSPTIITALLRDSEWVVAHRGVYGDGEVWRAAEPYRERPLLRARAAVMAMRRAWVLSHDSAAHLLGLAVLADEDAHAHITRPGFTNAWTKGRVKHHLARYRDGQVVDVDGTPALDAARTVCDVAREHGFRAGLVTADSALRLGVRRGDLWEAVDSMRSWPYVTTVRNVIEAADGRAETPIESLARELLLEMGLAVDPQFPVVLADGRVAWADLRVGCHVFETHGLVKVLTPEQGGVADREARAVLFDERKRERLLTGEGLGVTNLYWSDFFSGRAAARARIRADLRESERRFGLELPEHLARNARELRGRDGRPSAG
ncbi:type IV toxin-antitoxin system AbiEi family antitoxin domain-containing protein [Nocardioides litoris]|uniref:type IV toxin-antitoxin system AbiEi family antitoxin domain-containing protein n=1 Tax=Nocardioides litoris TaxID=1926648 RepID=UPI0011247332|nr:type IV toxin-antitoxin system AbiEi family antitoxin domain-containing protein [Nocardioides litoris]